MRKQDALLLAMTAGTIAFAAAFAYSSVIPEAVLWYYPLDHRWAFEIKPTGLAMDFYGRTLQGAIAWCLVVVPTLAITRKVRAAGPRIIALFAVWAVTAVILVMVFYGWTLHYRRPVPAPIPSWYQPR